MARPEKYSILIVSQIIELAYIGHTDIMISKIINIGKNTLVRWKKKYPHLKNLMLEARSEGAKETIEVSLRRLARGTTEKTTKESYKTFRVNKKEDNNGKIEHQRIPVKIETVTKEISPDIRAIRVLAKKYSKGFINKENDKQVEKINLLEGFNMRDLQDSLKSDGEMNEH